MTASRPGELPADRLGSVVKSGIRVSISSRYRHCSQWTSRGGCRRRHSTVVSTALMVAPERWPVNVGTVSDWSVEFHPACEEWADELDQTDAEPLLAAILCFGTSAPHSADHLSTR